MSRNTIWRLAFTAIAVAVLALAVITVVQAGTPDVPEPNIVKLSEDEHLRWSRYRIDGVECIAYHDVGGFSGVGGLSCDWEGD